MPDELITDGGFLAANNDEDLLLDDAWVPAHYSSHYSHMDLTSGVLELSGLGWNDDVFMMNSHSFVISMAGSSTPSEIADDALSSGQKEFTCLLWGSKLYGFLSGIGGGSTNEYIIESSSTFTLPDPNNSIIISVDASIINDAPAGGDMPNFTISIEPTVNIILEKADGSEFQNIIRKVSFNNNFNNVTHTNSWVIHGVAAGTYRPLIMFRMNTNYDGTWGTYARHKITLDNISVQEVVAVPVIHDLEMNGFDSVSIIPFTGQATSLEVEDIPPDTEFNKPLLSGWNIWSCPLDITTLIVGHNEHPSKGFDDIACEADGTYSMEDFIKNHLYESMEDTQPAWYKLGETAEGMDTFMDLVKNNVAYVYWPTFSFNGIGDIAQYEGYQMRLKASSTTAVFKWKGTPLYSPDLGGVSSSDIMMPIINGWNIICFPSLEEADATAFFANMVANNELQIVKNNNADVYWPEFGFNGIGNLKPGEGYQIRCYNL